MGIACACTGVGWTYPAFLTAAKIVSFKPSSSKDVGTTIASATTGDSSRGFRSSLIFVLVLLNYASGFLRSVTGYPASAPEEYTLKWAGAGI